LVCPSNGTILLFGIFCCNNWGSEKQEPTSPYHIYPTIYTIHLTIHHENILCCLLSCVGREVTSRLGAPRLFFNIQILTLYQLLDQDNERFWIRGQKHLPRMKEIQMVYPFIWGQGRILGRPSYKLHLHFCKCVGDTELISLIPWSYQVPWAPPQPLTEFWTAWQFPQALLC